MSWVAEYAKTGDNNGADVDGDAFDDDMGMDELDQDADAMAAKTKKKKQYVDDVLGVVEGNDEGGGKG